MNEIKDGDNDNANDDEDVLVEHAPTDIEGLTPYENLISEIQKWVSKHAQTKLCVNRWFETPVLKVFLRVNNRLIHPDLTASPEQNSKKVHRVIDIANFTVYAEYLGRGYFSKLLQDIETVAKKNGIFCTFIENILSEFKHEESYKKRGYTLYKDPFGANVLGYKFLIDIQ
jgi:GNAT superfamily N-acetyltransferase